MYCNLSLAQIIRSLNKCNDHDFVELWNSIVTLRDHGIIPLEFWEVLHDLSDDLFFDE